MKDQIKNRLNNLSHIFIVFIIFMGMGCYNNVYEIDKLSNGQNEDITGIDSLYKPDNSNINVNIVFIHGMGVHPIEVEMGKKGHLAKDGSKIRKDGSTRLYQTRIAKKLGFNQEDTKKETLTPLTLAPSKIVGGNLYRRLFKKKRADGKTITLNMFTLSWDKVTIDIQQAMFELDDTFHETKGSKNREKGRVYVNRALKKFINTSFADPAIYLGLFGPEIRKLVAQGIGEIDNIITTEILKGIPPKDHDKYNQIVHISDSLGSSVIFDTVLETMSNTNDPNDAKGILTYKTSIERFAAHTQLIYMNANQLPLIELGRMKGPLKDDNKEKWLNRYPQLDEKLRGFKKYREEHMEHGHMSTLQVVSFSDLNDPLSYYLTQRFKNHSNKDEEGEIGDSIRIVNVLLSNARWNYFFVLADPFMAHASGFKTNSKAINLVVHGTK